MEFWGQIGKKISTFATNAAGYTVKETEKITNIAKAKYKLSNLKTRLDAAYRQIGVLKYGEHLGSETDSSSYDDLFDQVTEICSEIEELDALILKYKNDHICEKCGSKLSSEMVFCPLCGAKQPIFDDEDEEASQEEKEESTDTEIPDDIQE